jgi:hypothetical protein
MLFRYLFILTCACCAISCNNGPGRNGIGRLSGNAQVISKIMQAQVDSWNNGSIDGFMRGYWRSNDLKFITKNGIRKGYDSVATRYKRHYNSKEKMGVLAFKNLEFSTYDQKEELVNVTGKWFIEQKEKTDSGFFSLLFKEIDSRWVIIVDHTW